MPLSDAMLTAFCAMLAIFCTIGFLSTVIFLSN